MDKDIRLMDNSDLFVMLTQWFDRNIVLTLANILLP